MVIKVIIEILLTMQMIKVTGGKKIGEFNP